MHSHVRPFWIVLLALSGVYADATGQDARTTAHMVYTEEQATRGEDVFWNICSECHFEEDFAGPFMQSWSGAMVKDLMDEIKATMPEDNPGGLEDSQYLDVITYMFKINGMPTGDTEISATDAGTIEIDWRPSYDEPDDAGPYD